MKVISSHVWKNINCLYRYQLWDSLSIGDSKNYEPDVWTLYCENTPKLVFNRPWPFHADSLGNQREYRSCLDLSKVSVESFPCGSAGKKKFTCNAGDLGSIPGLGRSPVEGKGYPLQYSDLENSMDSIVHWVAKSQTWLSDFHSVV